MRNKRVRVVLALALCMVLLGTAIGFAIVMFIPTEAAEEAKTEYYSVTDNGYSGNSSQKLLTPVAMNEKITEAASKARNSVITVETTIVTSQMGFPVTGQGAGSAVLYEMDGTNYYFITNAHVVADTTEIRAFFSNKVTVPLQLVGADANADLAVISGKIEDFPEELRSTLTPIEWADSDAVRVGDVSVAVGASTGKEFDRSVTVGIIGGTERQITVEGITLTVMQTDAAINPGNSGGALVNEEGQLIGINAAKVDLDSIEGMGFAIPANTAKEVAGKLKANGSIEHPDLGIAGYDFISADIAAIYQVPNGIYVQKLEMGSAGYQAGLKVGDIITEIDRQPLNSLEDLNEVLENHQPGDKLMLTVYRGRNEKSQTINIQLILGGSSDGASAGGFWN